ncbi:asparagine--tRNA ligase, cytoplasmic 2 [Magnolia sinica]|uniref:asparagine--tRNA ligase, cytoplasmic 2 n=1 Tax=Magnolia sinica TaxID=86752 RepID=UPI00265A47CA|nr:asparagine--tRNA ligase, cytoplasmic 2 [Magnolia sinica]
MASEEAAVVAKHPIEHLIDQSKYSKRILLKTILGRSDRGLGLVGERIIICGWVKSSKETGGNIPAGAAGRTVTVAEDVTCKEIIGSRIPHFLQSIVRVFVGDRVRPHGKPTEINIPVKNVPTVTYLLLNDGSCISSLQVVVHSSEALISKISPIGTCILAEGVMRQPSVAGKQVIELKVEKILHVGTVDLAKYPLAKRRLPLEILRSYPHLRPKTTVVASVTRIRNALTHGTHTFFQNNGFLHVHMPVITSTDLTDRSNTFQATTLFNKAEKIEDSNVMNDHGAINIEVVRAAIKEKSKRVQELQRSNSDKEALLAALWDLQKTNELALQMEAREKSSPGTSFQVGKVDFSEDFFSRQAYLTASSQLHLECYACALGSVYTFGPTFRAEKSHSSKHLAESWMVEIDMVFADLEDLMNCAEDYLKFLCQQILENCSDDLQLVSKRIDKASIDRLGSITSSSFERITYTKAVELLNEVTDKEFVTKAKWGINLAEEHERYLADEAYKKPVIIYDHPKEVRPFYVRLNDDGTTVATMDIVVPKVGTLIKGSQREERLDMISRRIVECGLKQDQYEWYFDLRRHGSAGSSGFSFGFDHMVMFTAGLHDIRDAIPFPRTSGQLIC